MLEDEIIIKKYNLKKDQILQQKNQRMMKLQKKKKKQLKKPSKTIVIKIKVTKSDRLEYFLGMKFEKKKNLI